MRPLSYQCPELSKSEYQRHYEWENKGTNEWATAVFSAYRNSGWCFARSDWLLKLGIISAIHLPAFFWISRARFPSFLRKKELFWCWLSTVLVYTKTIIQLSVGIHHYSSPPWWIIVPSRTSMVAAVMNLKNCCSFPFAERPSFLSKAHGKPWKFRVQVQFLRCAVCSYNWPWGIAMHVRPKIG